MRQGALAVLDEAEATLIHLLFSYALDAQSSDGGKACTAPKARNYHPVVYQSWVA